MIRLRPGVCLALPLILAGAASAQPPAPPAPAAPRPATVAVAPAVRPPPPAPASTPPPVSAVPVAPGAPPAVPAANELPPAADAAAPVKAAPAKPPEPLTRARSNVAIIQALDKVTAETIRFEAPVGQPVRYKTLVFTVRACETTAPDEPIQDYSAYLLIDSQAIPAPDKSVPPARQVFRGWMYAGSPGLNPLQHPVYDAWLIACKASAPVAPAPSR